MASELFFSPGGGKTVRAFAQTPVLRSLRQILGSYRQREASSWNSTDPSFNGESGSGSPSRLAPTWSTNEELAADTRVSDSQSRSSKVQQTRGNARCCFPFREPGESLITQRLPRRQQCRLCSASHKSPLWSRCCATEHLSWTSFSNHHILIGVFSAGSATTQKRIVHNSFEKGFFFLVSGPKTTVLNVLSCFKMEKF